MAGTLWIVATPIGHLKDLTFRALEVLNEVDTVLCEDTRRARKLFHAYDVQAELERWDENVAKQKLSSVLYRLKNGNNIALITDAGTPGISDPGSYLVRKAREHHIEVYTAPGASSLSAFLSISGRSTTFSVFRGFFPRKKKKIEQEIGFLKRLPSELPEEKALVVYFESPKRILETLSAVKENIHQDLDCVVMKELTKQYEQLWEGSLNSVYEDIEHHIQEQGPLGEWCFLVEIPRAQTKIDGAVSDEPYVSWKDLVRYCVDAEMKSRVITDKINQEYKIPKNVVYQEILRIFQKNSP